MRPMRGAGGLRFPEGGRVARGALAILLIVCCASGAAVAQTASPPPATPPGEPPPAVVIPKPSGAPPAGLESGDTAPPGSGLVETKDPLHAPPLPQASQPYAPGVAAPLVAPVPPAPQPVPIYRKSWFWGAVGVVVVTGIVVSVLVLANDSPSTPNTTLGDMRAF